QLCYDEIEEWIKENPTASICTAEGVEEFRDVALFQDYHGLAQFRQAVAKFMGKARGRVSFDPNRIVMGGGATGASEIVMFCLADPGDGFLVPTPYYPGFDRDLRWRTGVKLFPVVCESSNDFAITTTALEEAYQKAASQKIRIKGLILSNPSNPLGTTLDRDTLKALVSFVDAKRIHLVCDEIYAATVFRSPEFVSLSEVIAEVECDRDLIHVVYSLSKDLGLPGFRVGIVYSYNDRVVACARRMSSFGLVSSQTQRFLAAMLSDEEFVERLVAESRRRLEARHGRFVRGVEEVGIRCLGSNAGLFCWMDLRSLLKSETVAGEIELWRAILREAKLNVSPGSAFHCSEPGWFRACFANMDDETMEIALRRIRSLVKTAPNRERLNLSPRLFNEAAAAATPSPPPSPMLRART
ncbi:1-aminocyclopropane-1-carboxylate synthase, partial [Genlisea aurea]